MPFPYVRLIVGTRHCRVLILGYINSDATGIGNIVSGCIGIVKTVNSQQLKVNCQHLINSGCAGMTSEDTAVPFPYVRLIVGKRHCRVLILGYINSDSTGIDNGELGRI